MVQIVAHFSSIVAGAVHVPDVGHTLFFQVVVNTLTDADQAVLVEYLVEAKWQKANVSIQDLDGFSAKVNRKLDNTLGLFLSINGFSADAVSLHFE